jgi:hypothetical protein
LSALEEARSKIRDLGRPNPGQPKTNAQETKVSKQQTRAESAHIQATPVGPAQPIKLPLYLLKLEQPPVLAIDNNPALKEEVAARLLDLSHETLKKWRQRGIGPNYIQYGPDGPVRYLLNDLMEFRSIHTIKTKPIPVTIEVRRKPSSNTRKAR